MGNRFPNFKILFCVVGLFGILFFVDSVFSATGVLLSVKGKVSVISADKAVPAKAGLRLSPGAVVKSLGGTTSILLADGRMHMLKSGSSYQVPAGEKKDTQNPIMARLVDTLKETAQRGQGPTVKAMVRGEKEVLLVFPFNSYIDKDALRFEWEKMDDSASMTVYIKCYTPLYKYSFQAGPGQHRATLPEDAPALTPDVRYYWKVSGSGVSKDSRFDSKLGWFGIPGFQKEADRRRKLQRVGRYKHMDDISRLILAANVNISFQMYHRAADLLTQCLRLNPQDVGIRELLTGVLLAMKNVHAAEKINR